MRNEKGTSALRVACLCLSIGLLPACAGNGNGGARRAGDGPLQSSAPGSWSFDEHEPGAAPERWTIAQTNPSEQLAEWRVLADDSAPSDGRVLACARTANRGHTFNLALAEDGSFGDLLLTVSVKALSGEEDQGGGPLWRCADENNYYVCRFNPLESNFRVYVVKEGVRTELQSASVETTPGMWYEVQVAMQGNMIACYLDGKKLLHLPDNTFAHPGRVGLWTKADAVTSFDDLTVEER